MFSYYAFTLPITRPSIPTPPECWNRDTAYENCSHPSSIRLSAQTKIPQSPNILRITALALKTAGQHVAMENDIVVGVGARAASVDRYDFAEAALSQVFSIALELARDKSLCVAGRLAAQLHIARSVVGSAADPKLHSRILKLLRDLERVCAVCHLTSGASYRDCLNDDYLTDIDCSGLTYLVIV